MSHNLQQISRRVVQSVFAKEQAEGVGARVRRSIGTRDLRNLSPFLMLDQFRVDEGAGFADHPHRGQTTVTYMLEGYFEHEDFAGHRGIIGPGDLQWMLAGRGIMHAEMPLHYDKAGQKLPVPAGLQLWIDLPEDAKKSEPQYQEYKGSEIPSQTPRAGEPADREGEGWKIKVIAGRSHGVESPVRAPENGGCWYLDVALQPGGWAFQEIPHGWNAFIYVLQGDVAVGDADEQSLHKQFHTLVLSNPGLKTDSAEEAKAVLSNTDGVRIANTTDKPAHLVVIAGQPLEHPVVQYGPFVVTSMDEVYKAVDDFQNARNGFERAANWQSEIAKGFR
ncbi:hypothetical protein MSPP1_000590 [Malassezia sp. CBS 17886]|nr:hypothetical protein MSPP1_000590 [Malassezia sp. CBS 17886]